MERGPLSTDNFKKFADKVVLFCHITSKITGEKYGDLLHKKGGAGGWPFGCFMDGAGRILAVQNSRKMIADGVFGFEETLNTEVRGFYDLEKKAKSGDKKAMAEFFMRRLELGHLERAELEAATGKGTFLSPRQVAEVAGKLAELRAEACLAGIDMDKPESFGPYAEKLMKLHKTTGLPEGPAGINSWLVVMEHARLGKDAKTFRLAFTAVKAAGLRHKRFVKKCEAQLKEIEKAGKQGR